ncbi:biotin--[acetyl-CoA-carboxylase] ligase [Marinilactibacillus sp. XAAS-LB27]|uniref:biotin--[acetyl-CoA-carboxylase] ligase n=1 Tax=Marinilactibacillus sp. XAAS-LB27 TaxID=3114538 RepID=UPI002E182C70|nr:biotin--[acetyl-CoA-carboxylase] ligase [Marinilactibacillus sp. XAAS-LB27]
MVPQNLKAIHLDYLNSEPTHSASIIEVSEACSCSEKMTKKVLEELSEDGMPIKFDFKTVTLLNPILSKTSIINQLETERIGHHIILLQSVDSTNDYIKKHLSSLNHGSLVLAHEQTVGKGRLGRQWSSPAGKTISMSLLLKPSNQKLRYSILTQMAAAALVQSLSANNIQAEIKWPNDVLVHKKKISGILTEAEYSGSQLEGIIIGIGVNTNLDKEDIPLFLKEKASSLKIEVETVDPNKIISKFLEFFETYYESWLSDQDSKPFLDVCRKHSALIGHQYWIEDTDSRRKASIDSLDVDGALVVTYLDTSETTPLISTHYSIRGDNGYI